MPDFYVCDFFCVDLERVTGVVITSPDGSRTLVIRITVDGNEQLFMQGMPHRDLEVQNQYAQLCRALIAHQREKAQVLKEYRAKKLELLQENILAKAYGPGGELFQTGKAHFEKGKESLAPVV